MTDTDGVYYPTYSFASDNDTLLLSPTATLTATLDGTAVELTDGAYTYTEDGTLVVTASADGYTSTSVSIDATAYKLYRSPSTSYDEINSSNIESVLGSDWTGSESGTRWANWYKTGGNSLDGNAEGSSTDNNYYYYTYSTSGTISLDDYAQFKDGSGSVILLVGFGFGSNSRSTTASVPNAVENSIGEYTYGINSSSGVSETTGFTHYINSSTLAFTNPQSMALSSATYYVPAEDYTKTIPSYLMASFSAPVDVAVPDGVTVYAATACDGSTVTLTEVETDVIPANTGVILAANETGDITLDITSEGSSADFTGNLLVATSSEPTAGAENDGYAYYGLYAENEETTAVFAQITAGTEFASGKAYLKVEGSSSDDETSEAKSLKIVFGTTTGISEISSSKAQEAGAFYNLQGVKVQSPTKGLYIQDGKKVILK